MRKSRRVECHLSHHIDAVPDIVHAHLVHDHIDHKVGSLHLKLGISQIAPPGGHGVAAVDQNEESQKELQHQKHEALLKKVRQVLVRVLVFPLVLESHCKEGRAVHVGVVLQTQLFWGRWT